MHAEEKTRLVFMPRTRLCFIDLDLKEFLSRECLYIYIYIYGGEEQDSMGFLFHLECLTCSSCS
jgi:hypothetical protein